jgi:hypothetical protein
MAAQKSSAKKSSAKKSSAKKPAAKRGTAGTRGPVPKRSTERRRRNKSSQVETVTLTGLGPVAVPPPDDAWHPIALDWYRSLAESGQSQFYEPSDWQAARVVAEVLSRNLKQGKKFSSALFASVWAAMGDLLTTEADRRRVRMEIERGGDGEKQPAGVTAIADYRDRLASGGKRG